MASGIYKVRSVADMHWNNKICHLVGNDYTFFMRISPWMKSYHEKEWEKVQPTGKQVERKERARLETKILNERRGNARSVITLKQLISKGTAYR